MDYRVFNTEGFIKKAQEIHRAKYDYSSVVYQSTKKKILIKCPEHGFFGQSPNSHLRGSGCPKCGHINTNLKNEIGLESFLSKARKIHSNRYGYFTLLLMYRNVCTEVDIQCSKHGLFRQTPIKHLSGQGCPLCARESVKYNALTTEKFIAKAIIVHGSYYDYSQVDYKKSCIKIKILCPKHGVFEQTPNNHLRAMRCEKCTLEENGLKRRFSTQIFIDKAKRVHRGKYDYSQVDYKGCFIKTGIICQSHGVFHQTPASHLSGKGCPLCLESQGEIKISEFFDSIGLTYERQKTFEGCRRFRNLPFDFFIPSLNACVEYDGRQHFEPVEYYGGVSAFECLKETDSIKNAFCLKSGISLIRVSYKKRSRIAIETVLRREFLKLPHFDRGQCAVFSMSM